MASLLQVSANVCCLICDLAIVLYFFYIPFQDMGTEVAQFRHEKLLREQELQRQLYEEEMITQALTQLVTEQAEIIAQLQSGE